MSRQFVIWGSSGHATVLSDIVHAQGGSIRAFFDNDRAARRIVDGVPLFVGREGFAEWRRGDVTRDVRSLIAIGGGRGAVRLELAEFMEANGVAPATLIASDASVASSASLGAGSQVLPRGVVAARARLGRQTIVNHGAQVDHECSLDDGVHLAPGAVLCGCVEVGHCAFIGAGSVVLPRITIGAGATVGAGAVVTRNVPPGAVVVGNPARPVEKIPTE